MPHVPCSLSVDHPSVPAEKRLCIQREKGIIVFTVGPEQGRRQGGASRFPG